MSILKMTRKDFFRTAMSAAAGLYPLRFAKGQPPLRVADVAETPLIPQINPIIRLYPAKAIERTGDIRFGAGEMEIMLPWFGSGAITWDVTVPEHGSYEVAACYSSTVPGSQLEV